VKPHLGWRTQLEPVPRWVLDAIGWDEYIRSAKQPYPIEVLDTQSNRDAQERQRERATGQKTVVIPS
jgi:hypothetical protein